MVSELLPCPFCGCEDPELQQSGFGNPEWVNFCCRRCASTTGACADSTKAVAAWNRRASPSQVAPANPAQVTDKREAWLAEAKYDALVEEAKDFAERMTSQPWACELIEKLLDALTAAIGAGGQAVAVKPMIWEEDHGIAGMGPYRLFKAETPLGRFVYGTDAEGSAYYHTASSGVMMVGDEATAQRLAEAAWQKAALAEVGKFVDPVALSQPHPADERVVEDERIRSGMEKILKEQSERDIPFAPVSAKEGR